MSTRRVSARIAAALAGATLVLSGCGQGLYGRTLPGGADLGDDPIRLTAEFREVLDLVPQSMVKVNDVIVGRVDKIELSDWHAKLSLRIRGDVKLPANARATVKMTSLLGEKYVALLPPTTETPEGQLADGTHIPLARTDRDVEVEEALGALSLLINGGGLAQLQVITRELNLALGGNETEIKSLLGQLNVLVGSLNRQKDRIVQSLVNVDKLAQTLNAQRATLLKTLDAVPPALKILNEERDDIVALLQSIDRLGGVATRVINESAANLKSTLRDLGPVAKSLADVGRDLPEALHLVSTFPFPKDTTTFIGGDYANLRAHLDLDLTNILNNLGSSPPTLPRATNVQPLQVPVPLIPGMDR